MQAGAATAFARIAAAVGSLGEQGPDVHPFNFVIGASAALLSACLSTLGVNLQASALRAQRSINVLAETAAAASAAGLARDGLQLLIDTESVDDEIESSSASRSLLVVSSQRSQPADGVASTAAAQPGTSPLTTVTTDPPAPMQTYESLSERYINPPSEPASTLVPQPTDDASSPLLPPSRSRITADMGVFQLAQLLLSSRLSRIERAEALRRLYLHSQWYLGFSLYLICQLFGSVVALGFISPVVLAPLGAAGLIFNIIFSRIFLGTRITGYDWIGTVLIVVGCAIVSTFGTNVSEKRQTIDDIIRLFSRPAFVAYFSVQLTLVVATFSLIKYLEYGLQSMRTMLSQSARSSISQVSGVHLTLSPQSNSTSPLASLNLQRHTGITRSYTSPPFMAPATSDAMSSQMHNGSGMDGSPHSIHHSLSESNLLDGHASNQLVSEPDTSNISSHRTSAQASDAHGRSGQGRHRRQHHRRGPTGRLRTDHSTRHEDHNRHGMQEETQPLLQGGSSGEQGAVVDGNADPSNQNGIRSSQVSSSSSHSAIGLVVGLEFGGGGQGGFPVPRPMVVRVKRGQLTALIGVLYAIVGGIAASETLMLTKSGVELIVTSVFDSDNQFQGAFSFLLLAMLLVTIVMQLYSLNRGLHYHLPVVVIPVFYTLFTCLSLANTMVYMDQMGAYSATDLLFLVLGIAVIVGGVWVLRKSQGSPDGDGV